MWADTKLLLEVYWQIGRAESSRKSWLVRLSVPIVAMVVAGFSFAVGFGLGKLLQLPQLAGQIDEGTMPGLLLTIVLFGMLFLGFAYALNALFLVGDMERLMVAPLDTRAIFLAKLLSGYPSLTGYVMVLAMPTLIGYGLGAGLGLLYFIAGVLLLLASPLFGIALGALLSLLIVRVLPVKRLREYLNAFLILFGAIVAIMFQIPNLINMRRGNEFDEASVVEVGSMLDRFEGLPLPSMWAGDGLADLGRGDLVSAGFPIFVYLLMTVGLFVVSAVVANSLYAAGWLRLQGASADKKGLDKESKPGLLSSQSFVVSLAVKDWLMRLRDSRMVATLLGQAVSSIVLIFIIFFAGGGNNSMLSGVNEFGGTGFEPALAIFSPGVLISGMVVAIGITVLGQIANTSLALEGQSLHILKMAPVDGKEVVRGKILGALIPFVVLAVILFVGGWVLFRFSLGWAPYGLICALIIGSGLISFYVAMGFPWAHFDWEDPRKMGRGRGGLFAFVGAAIMGVGLCLIAAVPFMAAAFDLAPAVVLALAGMLIVGLLTGLLVRWSTNYAARAFAMAGES